MVGAVGVIAVAQVGIGADAGHHRRLLVPPQQRVVLGQAAAQASRGEGGQDRLESGEVHGRGVSGLVSDAGTWGEWSLWELPPTPAWGTSTRCRQQGAPIN